LKLRWPEWANAAVWIGLVCGVSAWLHVQTSADVAPAVTARPSVAHLKQGAAPVQSAYLDVQGTTATVPSLSAGSGEPADDKVVIHTEKTTTVETAAPAAAASSDIAATAVSTDEPAGPAPAELLSDLPKNSRLTESDWIPTEFEQLAAPSYETTDILSQLAIGAVITPPQTLSMEELLAANRPLEPIGYGAPSIGTGLPYRIGTGTPGAEPVAPGPVAAGKIQIESSDYLDYDEEHNQVYGQGRIVVRFGEYKLEANRILVDTRLQEVQAYGHVILSSPTQYVEAESLWFDALHNQGVGYNARGHSGNFYVLGGDPHCEDGTTIRQVSEEETVFKDSSFTECDFPVPHYRLRAKEFTIISNERIFARNVCLYVLECPVLWLPYFTRAFHDENPFGASLGLDSQLGFFVRLFYDYHHSCYTPSDQDDRIMIKSSAGHARLRLDFFSKRGFGEGLRYGYSFDYGRHFGDLDVYHLSDSARNVDGASGAERNYIDWFHRTRVNDELDFMVDLNYASDPDIFYDVLDRVRGSSEDRRGRIAERHLQTGFEWTCDDFFAGLQVELKDRIGRNRVSDFAEFRDGDFDFDRRFNNEDFFTLTSPGVGPDGRFYPLAGRYTDPASLDDSGLDVGVSSRRYGRVTERLPQLTVSTNRERLWCLPLWYHMDLNVFNNLDKGLNIVGRGDDSFVQGFDLYQSISHLQKFCDRYTLLTKVGFGIGAAQRDDDSYNLKFPAGATFPYVYDGQLINGQPVGLTFVDRDTFLVGRRRMSLSDVEPLFAYGDIDSRFNARISECMTGFIRYRFREGTDNNLGTFYESIGARKSMDDLYAFRTPEHWLEGGLSYNLDYPRVTANFTMGQNLQGEGQITPNELLGYRNLGLSYTNLCNTLILNGGVGMQERQLRDPTDPNAFTQEAMTYYLSGSYLPIHQRWWTRVSAYFIDNQTVDPLGLSGSGNRDLDTRDETILDYTIGRKIGPKYLVEFRSVMRTRTTDSEDNYLKIERDLHDMVAGISLGMRSRNRLSTEDETAAQDNFQLRLNFRFKPASEKGVTPTVVRSSKLYTADRASAFERGG
jgi:hypothetical protein